jgi:VanZ family protein
LGYICFVVYGSLVPLQYQALPFDEAWAAFQNIPYLQLGIDSRADWVANGVLYVPVGFLTVFLLTSSLRRAWAPLLFGFAAMFCVSLAVSVEFTQLYFPPRTVSLNDVIAEIIGSLIGIAIAARLGNWFASLLLSFVEDTRRLLVLGLDAYVMAYLAFALFPFDFLLSWSELADKLHSEAWGWLLAGSGHRLSIQLVKLLAEIGLTLPFGLLLARLAGQKHAGYTLAVVTGLLLGGFIEVAQFFIASGISQGLSVLTRVAGVCAGLALSRYVDRRGSGFTLNDAGAVIRRFVPYLAIPYGLTLLEVNGWLAPQWQGVAAARAQLAEVNFLPFYYHYYTTEAIALFSLAAVAMSYLPVGVMAWATKRAPIFAAVLAILIAGVIETGKLFINGSHPDPTNLSIAAAAAWMTASLLALLSAGKLATHQDLSKINPIHESILAPKDSAHAPANRPAAGSRVAMVLCLALAAAWVFAFPSLRLLIAVVLAASCIAVWFQPRLIFAVIPAALPVFDLAPWSGRFFLDEFDVLVLTTLAVACVRAPANPRPRPDVVITIVATLLVLSFSVSTVRGLMPFTSPDFNAFNNYFSHFNALRIAKGGLWALLIWRLSRRFFAANVDVRQQFAWGMTAGLALTVLWVIWERAAFPGLWAFNDDYRVTGPFSATHTGGAYIDCFLAAAIPYLIVLTLRQRNWLVKMAGVGLTLASTYVLMVTYSRGGYLAFAVAVVVVSLAVVLKSARRIQSSLVFAGLAVAMVLVALPVFRSDFLQSRLASASVDFDFRSAHWADALAIRDPDAMTSLFGMGVGRFPEAKYWRSTLHPKVATYRLLTEKTNGRDNPFLRLDAGESIGVEQFVAIEPGQKYVLKFDVRPSHANTRIAIPICEKWLLTSFQCVTPAIDLGAQKGAWRSVELEVDARELTLRPWPLARPFKLSLTHSLPHSTLDIDNLRLLGENNSELLQNGDYSHGLDHWFFSIAGTLHAHWRTHNLFVGTLFDQGWFGLVTMLALLGVACVRAAQGVWRGDVLAAGSLAAVCGFVIGGLLDTQIDSPRFLLLLLLLAWASVFPCNAAKLNSQHSDYGQRAVLLRHP